MADFWGRGVPTVYLKYPDNPKNWNEVDLPGANAIETAYEPVYSEVKTRSGRIVRRKKGWRFRMRITWVNISTTNMANFVKIANWEQGIHLVPHGEMGLIGHNVEIDAFEPSNPNSRATHIDNLVMEFVANDVKRILDYDNALLTQEGMVCDKDLAYAPALPDVVDFVMAMGDVSLHYAIDFDSTYRLGVDAGDAGDFNPLLKDFALELWIKLDVVDAIRGIVAKGSHSAGQLGYTVRYDNSTGVIRTSIGFSTPVNIDIPNISVDTWYHLVVMLDRSNKIYVYLNGTRIDDVSIAAYVAESLTNASDFQLGEVSGFSKMDGQVALVRFYDFGVAGIGGAGPSLVAFEAGVAYQAKGMGNLSFGLEDYLVEAWTLNNILDAWDDSNHDFVPTPSGSDTFVFAR